MAPSAVIVSLGEGESTTEAEELVGEYSFSKTHAGRPCFHCETTKAGKDRWLYWADGTWYISDELGVLRGDVCMESDAAEVPRKGWIVRGSGWFSSDAPVGLLVEPAPEPARTLLWSSPQARASGPGAQDLNGVGRWEAAKIRCKTAASECRDFLARPDTVHCVHAALASAKDIGLAVGSFILAVGYCCVEIGRDAQRGIADAHKESPFIGTYSDVNHPGCPRTIRYKADSATEVEIIGHDGDLNAPWLGFGKIDKHRIVVDLSSKGGPADLEGKFTGTGICWVRNGGEKIETAGSDDWPKEEKVSKKPEVPDDHDEDLGFQLYDREDAVEPNK